MKPRESDGTVAFTGWQIWSVVRLVTSTQIWPYQNRQVEKSESPVLGHLGNVGGSDAARRLFELRNARASQFFAKEQGREPPLFRTFMPLHVEAGLGRGEPQHHGADRRTATLSHPKQKTRQNQKNCYYFSCFLRRPWQLMHSRCSHEPAMKLRYATQQRAPLQIFCHHECARRENLI